MHKVKITAINVSEETREISFKFNIINTDHEYTLKVTTNKLPIVDILNFHSTQLESIHTKIVSWTQKDLGIENYLSLLRFGLWIEAHSPPLYGSVNM